MTTYIKKIIRCFFENVVSITIILIAIIFSFQPTIFGIQITMNNIIMVLFSLLAIDSITNKFRLGHTINNKIDNIDSKINNIGTNNILKRRYDFDRLENTFNKAKKELFISGINLEGIVPSCTLINNKAKQKCKIRLLLLDSNGTTLDASSRMSGVDKTNRKMKIDSNLKHLLSEFDEGIQNNTIEVKIIDHVLPFSFIGIDINEKNATLIIQHYLFKTPSEDSPMLELTHNNSYWFNLYLGQLKKMWEEGVSVKNST